MQGCVEFQYRIAIYENIQMDILELKNKVKISISGIKIPKNDFNNRLEKKWENIKWEDKSLENKSMEKKGM